MRDLVDLVTIHETIFPLGPVIWAAVEKSPGFTPEGHIAEIRRNSHYPTTEWLKLISSEPLDPKDITRRLRAALDEAEAFVMKMPTDKAGFYFSGTATLYSPIQTDWGRIKLTPGNGGATGRPAPTSQPRCSSGYRKPRFLQR